MGVSTGDKQPSLCSRPGPRPAPAAAPGRRPKWTEGHERPTPDPSNEGGAGRRSLPVPYRLRRRQWEEPIVRSGGYAGGGKREHCSV